MRASGKRVNWLLAATALVAAPTARGQEVIEIPSEPACPECTIRLDQVVVLGDAEGPGIIESDFVKTVRDSRGRYYVTTDYATRIKVFDAQGEFLAVIGRRGNGPGEFMGIGFVLVGPGDTLHVFDDSQRRWTVLSPSYEYVRSSNLEVSVYVRGVLFDDGRVVLPSPVHTPERIGLPLHLLDTHGSVIRSFGSETGFFRPDVPRIDERKIARADRDAVWSAYRNQYVIERWDLDGRKLEELRRDASWFPPRLAPQQPGSSHGIKAPDPIPIDLQQDARGRLWVLISVAGTEWRRGVEAGGFHGVRIIDDELYQDMMVEVIDPESGRLIQSARFPQQRLQFVDDGLVGTVVLDSLDVPYVGVWRIGLKQP